MAKMISNEAIIADTLGCAPDRRADLGEWRFCRWRQFVSSYQLPALVDPVMVMHVGGKPDGRVWEAGGWSASRSIPGCATVVPAGFQTGWRLDGELDVVTISIPLSQFEQRKDAGYLEQMRFAFADPLGIALTRQILHELYAPETADRRSYVGILLEALRAHTLRPPAISGEPVFPSADFSAYRIHRIMNDIAARPERDHSLDALSARAGITPSHFCRVFKRATGRTPHQFVMKARLDRAQDLLGQSSLSVAQVAEMTGFASQSHFTRAFRQYAGQTPTDWRHTIQ